MKFLISIPLAAGNAAALYYYNFLNQDWWYIAVIGVICIPLYTRLAEFILGKPMWVGGKRGNIGKMSTVGKDQTGYRIFILILNLAVAAGLNWAFLNVELKSESTEPKQTPAEQMDKMYESMH